GEQFRIPVDVGNPIEPAAEPGAGEFGCVEIDIGFGQPSRQRRWRGDAAEQTTLTWHHAEGLRAGRRIAGDHYSADAERRAYIIPVLRPGAPPFLGIEPVPHRPIPLPPPPHPPSPPP